MPAQGHTGDDPGADHPLVPRSGGPGRAEQRAAFHGLTLAGALRESVVPSAAAFGVEVAREPGNTVVLTLPQALLTALGRGNDE